MTKPKLELNIDSTALGLSGCILALFRHIVGSINPETNQSEGGYKEHALPASMKYGVCVHKYIDTMYKTGGSMGEALKAAKYLMDNLPSIPDPKKPHLSDYKHLFTVCGNLWTDYIMNDTSFDVLELNGKPATEITFSIPYFEDDIIKVNLCGTIDRIGKIHNGCYCIRDWKTTSSWDTRDYFTSYELSRQLRFYSMALRLMKDREPESTLGKIAATSVGVAIDGIFLNKEPNESTFQRSEVMIIPGDKLDKFQATLDSTLRHLSACIRDMNFPPEGIIRGICERRFTENVSKRCVYWNVCNSSEAVGELLLNRDFKRVKFDPLNYNEI